MRWNSLLGKPTWSCTRILLNSLIDFSIPLSFIFLLIRSKLLPLYSSWLNLVNCLIFLCLLLVYTFFYLLRSFSKRATKLTCSSWEFYSWLEWINTLLLFINRKHGSLCYPHVNTILISIQGLSKHIFILWSIFYFSLQCIVLLSYRGEESIL